MIRELVTDHPMPMEKFGILHQRLKQAGPFRFLKARTPTYAEFESIHNHEYVFRVFGLGRLSLEEATEAILTGKAPLDADCAPLSPDIFQMHRMAFGGTLTGLRYLQRNGGVCLNLHGGFHHAHHARGAGFCLFNDLAAAARLSRGRALVLDVDAHQGDGTAAILERDRDAFTLSLHAGEGYPMARPQSNIDIALKSGTGDAAFMNELEPALEDALRVFKPEVVIYQAGVDSLATDALGLLGMTQEGIQRRDRFVVKQCADRKIPLLVTMGGGYSSLKTTMEAHWSVFAAAADIHGE